MDRAVFVSFSILCLLSVSSITGFIQVVKADGETVYIRADGSIDPPAAPISSVDNITYTFTGNINYPTYNGIIVERSNIVIDGNGYTLQGNSSGNGLNLTSISNVTVKNTNIEDFYFGIFLYCSSNNIVSGNNVTANSFSGIRLDSSSNNTIIGNNIANNRRGIMLYAYSDNNIVSGNNATANNYCGIALSSSYSNSISGSNIANTDYGIFLGYSSNNSISGNTLTASNYGILLASSYSNNISGNNIANNDCGIWLQASNNRFYHNNFIGNSQQVSVEGAGFAPEYIPVWDDGRCPDYWCPLGNYWSDYNGTDANQDGIGDTQYVIDASNVDNYPLMGMYSSFEVWVPPYPAGGFENVHVITNFTISDLDLYVWLTTPNQYLQPGQLFLSLNPVQGQNMTAGFCRMTVPNNILNTSEYIVLIDLTPISVKKLFGSNSTHTVLYFVFTPSEYNNIIIVPEFPSFLILPLFFIATLLAAIYKKKGVKTRQRWIDMSQ